MQPRRVAVVLLAIAAGRQAQAEPRRELSFADAVNVALAHNGVVGVARADVDIARTDIDLARSVFDAHVVANLQGSREVQPGNSSRFAWTDTAVIGSVEYDGRTEYGLRYGLELGTLYDRLSDPFNTVYKPATTATVTLKLEQPLMRGFGRAANRAPIDVASRRADVSERELRRQVEDLVSDVEVAYWNLALGYKEIEARQASLKLAEEQVSQSQRLHAIGSIAELDVTEARAGVERMKLQLASAQRAVLDAEGKLRAVIIGAPDWKPDEQLVPTDSPSAAPASYSVDEQLALALKYRPDLAVAHSLIVAEQSALAAARNDLAPQLDLVGAAGIVGFAGDLAQTYATSTVGLDPPFTPDGTYQGGPLTTVKNLATAGDYMVMIGLRLDLPVNNSAARARYARQEHALARARLAKAALLAQIENEIRTSIKILKTDSELRLAADRAVAVNEELLAGMRKRFSAGALTSFDILRVTDELTRSQIAAARARVSYQISLARLARANGTLLDSLHITVPATGSH
jgi:outer membrane protein